MSESELSCYKVIYPATSWRTMLSNNPNHFQTARSADRLVMQITPELHQTESNRNLAHSWRSVPPLDLGISMSKQADALLSPRHSHAANANANINTMKMKKDQPQIRTNPHRKDPQIEDHYVQKRTALSHPTSVAFPGCQKTTITAPNTSFAGQTPIFTVKMSPPIYIDTSLDPNNDVSNSDSDSSFAPFSTHLRKPNPNYASPYSSVYSHKNRTNYRQRSQSHKTSKEISAVDSNGGWENVNQSLYEVQQRPSSKFSSLKECVESNEVASNVDANKVNQRSQSFNLEASKTHEEYRAEDFSPGVSPYSHTIEPRKSGLWIPIDESDPIRFTSPGVEWQEFVPMEQSLERVVEVIPLVENHHTKSINSILENKHDAELCKEISNISIDENRESSSNDVHKDSAIVVTDSQSQPQTQSEELDNGISFDIVIMDESVAKSLLNRPNATVSKPIVDFIDPTSSKSAQIDLKESDVSVNEENSAASIHSSDHEKEINSETKTEDECSAIEVVVEHEIEGNDQEFKENPNLAEENEKTLTHINHPEWLLPINELEFATIYTSKHHKGKVHVLVVYYFPFVI